MTKRRIPAKGVRKGCNVGLVVRLDDETFDTIRERAVKHGTSVAEQIRLLIEWGLESAQ